MEKKPRLVTDIALDIARAEASEDGPGKGTFVTDTLADAEPKSASPTRTALVVLLLILVVVMIKGLSLVYFMYSEGSSILSSIKERSIKTEVPEMEMERQDSLIDQGKKPSDTGYSIDDDDSLVASEKQVKDIIGDTQMQYKESKNRHLFTLDEKDISGYGHASQLSISAWDFTSLENASGYILQFNGLKPSAEFMNTCQKMCVGSLAKVKKMDYGELGYLCSCQTSCAEDFYSDSIDIISFQQGQYASTILLKGSVSCCDKDFRNCKAREELLDHFMRRDATLMDLSSKMDQLAVLQQSHLESKNGADEVPVAGQKGILVDRKPLPGGGYELTHTYPMGRQYFLSMCNKSGQYSMGCVLSMAKAVKDPLLCRELVHEYYVDQCLFGYAVNQSQQAVCTMVLDVGERMRCLKIVGN